MLCMCDQEVSSRLDCTSSSLRLLMSTNDDDSALLSSLAAAKSYSMTVGIPESLRFYLDLFWMLTCDDSCVGLSSRSPLSKPS